MALPGKSKIIQINSTSKSATDPDLGVAITKTQFTKLGQNDMSVKK